MTASGELRRIWKYPIPIGETVKIEATCNPVHVDLDPATGAPCVWMLAVPGAPTVPRIFEVYGTGTPVPDHARHVGSVRDGGFMWHVFEVTQ